MHKRARQNTFRGFKQRRAWLDALAAAKKRAALETAREAQRITALAADVEAAEAARAAATDSLNGGGPSQAALFRGRMSDALRQTVVTAEACERKAFAELRMDPRNRGRMEGLRLAQREVR